MVAAEGCRVRARLPVGDDGRRDVEGVVPVELLDVEAIRGEALDGVGGALIRREDQERRPGLVFESDPDEGIGAALAVEGNLGAEEASAEDRASVAGVGGADGVHEGALLPALPVEEEQPGADVGALAPLAQDGPVLAVEVDLVGEEPRGIAEEHVLMLVGLQDDRAAERPARGSLAAADHDARAGDGIRVCLVRGSETAVEGRAGLRARRQFHFDAHLPFGVGSQGDGRSGLHEAQAQPVRRRRGQPEAPLGAGAVAQREGEGGFLAGAQIARGRVGEQHPARLAGVEPGVRRRRPPLHPVHREAHVHVGDIERPEAAAVAGAGRDLHPLAGHVAAAGPFAEQVLGLLAHQVEGLHRLAGGVEEGDLLAARLVDGGGGDGELAGRRLKVDLAGHRAVVQHRPALEDEAGRVGLEAPDEVAGAGDHQPVDAGQRAGDAERLLLGLVALAALALLAVFRQSGAGERLSLRADQDHPQRIGAGVEVQVALGERDRELAWLGLEKDRRRPAQHHGEPAGARGAGPENHGTPTETQTAHVRLQDLTQGANRISRKDARASQRREGIPGSSLAGWWPLRAGRRIRAAGWFRVRVARGEILPARRACRRGNAATVRLVFAARGARTRNSAILATPLIPRRGWPSRARHLHPWQRTPNHAGVARSRAAALLLPNAPPSLRRHSSDSGECPSRAR